MAIRLILPLLILALPLLARAEVVTFHFQGDMELQKLSGGECGENERPGTIIPVELGLKVERKGTIERFEGYYSGPDIQTGYFSGRKPANLPLHYPEEGIATDQGHSLSLDLDGNNLRAEIHEKHLSDLENNCNFDHARLLLRRMEPDSQSELSFTRIKNRFNSETEYKQGYKIFEEGRIVESLPHLEKAVRLREETDGFSTQEMVYPALYLSMADLVSGRFDEGYKLQKRIFDIPMKETKRHSLQHVVLINLFSDQSRRLSEEGRVDQAISLIERSIAVYPDLTELQAVLAELFVDQDRLEEACDKLEKARTKHPDDVRLKETLAWCLVQRGNELFDADDPGISLELFRHALELNPLNRGIWDSILTAYAAVGTPAEGEILLQKSADLVIRAFGLKEYQKLQAYIFSEEARLTANNVINNVRQEELLRKAVALDPENPDYVTRLARIVHRSGHYEESQNMLRKQLDRCKSNNCRETIEESLQKETLLELLVKKLEL